MTFRSTTLTTEGRAIRRRLLVSMVVFLALALAVFATSRLSPDSVPGPDGSSFVTTSQGTAAFFELLERRGVPVSRNGAFLDGSSLDPAGAIIELEPGLFSGALDAQLAGLVDYLGVGGTVVLGGAHSDATYGALLGQGAPTVSSGGGRLFEIVGSPAGVDGSIVTNGTRVFSDTGTALVLAKNDSGAAAAAYDIGPGRVIVLSDIGPMTNAMLASDRNAAFLLAIIGNGPVVFDELIHGFQFGSIDERVGWIASAPPRARTTVWLLAAATVVALVAYARRFGPPEEAHRTFAPARLDYVESMAGILRRTRKPVEAVEPTMSAVRAALTERSGAVEQSISRDALVVTARKLGLTDEEATVAVDGPTDVGQVLALDRALAILTPEPMLTTKPILTTEQEGT